MPADLTSYVVLVSMDEDDVYDLFVDCEPWAVHCTVREWLGGVHEF